MTSVTVSDKGQVVIPVAIRRRLGIQPGSRLDFWVEGHVVHAQLERPFKDSRLESGFGLLRAKPTTPGATRDLNAFDVARTMREQDADERP